MERIIITFTRDGAFRGASAQDWDGMPIPIGIDQLAAIAPQINSDALNSVEELQASLDAAMSEKHVLERDKDALTAELSDANNRLAAIASQPVELTIKAWQAKAVLEALGLLQPAEAIIETMPDGLQKIAVQSAWRNNADFPRNSQTIISLAAGLALTDSDLDQMFAQAASLTI